MKKLKKLVSMDDILTQIWSGILILAIIGFVVYFIIFPLFERGGTNKQGTTSIKDNLINESEDKERKENIIKRVFAYKYENLIYEIFAPYARQPKFGGGFKYQRWNIDIDLEDEFIKSEISRILCVPNDDAAKIFKELLDNLLLCHINYKNKSGVGHILTREWDIISRNDMNLDRWMESHQNVESKESVDKRREPFNLCHYYPFHKFVNEHGNYEVTASSITSKDTFWINFPDKVKIVFSLQALGIKYESKRNREDEINGKLWDIPNLYVKVDDSRYSLVLQ